MAAAAALQAAAWHVAAGVLRQETVGAGPAATARARVRVHTLAAAAPAVPATDAHRPSVPHATVPPAPAPAPAAPAPSPLPLVVEDAEGSTLTQRPFYEYREVDVPAEPVGEWNLDPSALDALATSRIVATLFVGSDGTVLHCSVDEPARAGAAARHALAARLCETSMRPARRAGEAVASRRRIEIFTQFGG